MIHAGLEDSLARLDQIGTAIKVRPYRQVWRFSHAGQDLYLKFFPRRGQRLKRLVRGDPALREFKALQKLQKAGVPGPRAVAFLSGLTLGGVKGDAVLTRSLDPAETLDQYVHSLSRRGVRMADGEHRAVVENVIALLESLARNRLGHADLHLGNLLFSPPLPDPVARLFVLDAYALTSAASGTGLTLRHLQTLAYACTFVATRTDLLRGWRRLAPANAALPGVSSPVARRSWRKTVERATTDSAYVGKVGVGEWSGLYFKQHKFPPVWSGVAKLSVTAEDWLREWPRVLGQLDADTLFPLKRSASADVFRAEIVLAGVPVQVVVKRPYRRYWYRYVTELPRGTRAYRAWWKAWALLARGIPTAWPLACFERRRAGVVVDQVVICEFVPGTQLDHTDLGGLDALTRQTLFHRTGRLLRRIDETGLVHFDTKASNILVTGMSEATVSESHTAAAPPAVAGVTPAAGLTDPVPVLVDVDGVRSYSWRGEGLRRLVQSLQLHQGQFTAQDESHLRTGYAPFERR